MNEHDDFSYSRYTGPQQVDKAMHSLEGILTGIALDGVLTKDEVSLLDLWCRHHVPFLNRHPFNELYPAVTEALADGVIDEEEQKDLLWLCKRFHTENQYFDLVTSDMQRLQGIVSGIAADGVIEEGELLGLTEWLEEHDHLRTCWPYDEIDGLICSVLMDKKIDDEEHRVLSKFFLEFLNLNDHSLIETRSDNDRENIYGVCSMQPEITFDQRVFCFTGKSKRTKRSDMVKIVERFGGIFSKTVTPSIDFLVIGADGNPCWAYACYGRKVEDAISYRKMGLNLILVHENDFWDAVMDMGGVPEFV